MKQRHRNRNKAPAGAFAVGRAPRRESGAGWPQGQGRRRGTHARGISRQPAQHRLCARHRPAGRRRDLRPGARHGQRAARRLPERHARGQRGRLVELQRRVDRLSHRHAVAGSAARFSRLGKHHRHQCRAQVEPAVDAPVHQSAGVGGARDAGRGRTEPRRHQEWRHQRLPRRVRDRAEHRWRRLPGGAVDRLRRQDHAALHPLASHRPAARAPGLDPARAPDHAQCQQQYHLRPHRGGYGHRDHRCQAALSDVRAGGHQDRRVAVPEHSHPGLPRARPHHPRAVQLSPGSAQLRRRMGRHLQAGLDQQPRLDLLRPGQQRPLWPGNPRAGGLAGQVGPVPDRPLLRRDGRRWLWRQGTALHLQRLPAAGGRCLSRGAGLRFHLPRHGLLGQCRRVRVRRHAGRSGLHFSSANVVDGRFSYAGSALTTRYTVALVSWSDMSEMGRQKVEYVENREGIARYGIQQVEVTGFGCTSRGQAHRIGKWMLLTSNLETRSVTFSVGLDACRVRPGSVIRVADQHLAGRRIGGRIREGTVSKITVDAGLGCARATA
ncbi:phage tail protein [Achromobacter xylosoxidans]